MNDDKRQILTVIDYDGNAVVTVVIDEVFSDFLTWEDYWIGIIKELGISGENYEWHVTRPEDYIELRYKNVRELLKDMEKAS